MARIKNRNNFGGSRQQDIEFALASYKAVFVLKMKVKYDHRHSFRVPLCSMWICHQQLSICNPKILKSEVLQLKSFLDSSSLRNYFSSKVMAQFFSTSQRNPIAIAAICSSKSLCHLYHQTGHEYIIMIIRLISDEVHIVLHDDNIDQCCFSTGSWCYAQRSMCSTTRG